MKRFALGVAALLVTAGGSVATAAPSSQADGGDWCEKHSDAGARPEFDKRKPLAAGGGSRNGRVPNAFACYDASAKAADQDVKLGAVVNAWVDHEHGVLRVNCVPQSGSRVSERCNRIVVLPARASAAAPSVDVQVPSEDEPGRVTVGEESAAPTLAAGAGELDASLDVGSACVEVDRTPFCRENLGGE